MGAETFRRCFEAGDIEAVMADLAPGFTLYHAARSEPASAPAPIDRILEAARTTLGPDFRFTEHARGDGLHALRWTATIDGMHADGVDVVREDGDGRLLELRITMRPLPAIEVWSRLMGERLGDGHGPPVI
ncbi:MAG TPA: hypothetical protein VGF25_22200 [Thermoleophilaceae bacterium]|jgi:hypothetical protein